MAHAMKVWPGSGWAGFINKWSSAHRAHGWGSACVHGPGRRETTTLRIDKVKGCMFVNQYLVVKFLGRGACGKVFLCLNTYDLRLYAMKVR